MRRPVQRVRIYGVQDRRSFALAKLPWVVRYTIDGRHRSKSFRTKAEAERYRVVLLQAVYNGDRFDETTGEPESWQVPLADLRVHEWVRRWLNEQWPEWQPRTRASAAEALARFVTAALVPRTEVPESLRSYLHRTLGPDSADDRDGDLERWMDRNCLTLGDLDGATVGDIARQLTRKLDGEPLAATTAARYRTNARACVLAAVEAGAIPEDPWPARSRSRSRRKVARRKRSVDIRSLPDPETMERALRAFSSYQAGSRTYRVMTAVAYYAGLRPSEVAMLRVRALKLPANGWGRIDVTEADVSFDESGEPKTGPRSVPIPPVLVGILREWLDDNAMTEPTALLFRTRTGTRPSASNWGRAWHRALRSIGHEPLRVYDCRHAAATTWLRAGVPLGEVARRLGHSVETLVSTYVGALHDEEQVANDRIDRILRLGLTRR
jgi:integrase